MILILNRKSIESASVFSIEIKSLGFLAVFLKLQSNFAHWWSTYHETTTSADENLSDATDVMF